jgi:hypothetical protein
MNWFISLITILDLALKVAHASQCKIPVNDLSSCFYSEFSSFADLRINCNDFANKSINSIYIIPNKKIVLDDSFQLPYCASAFIQTIFLHNLRGILLDQSLFDGLNFKFLEIEYSDCVLLPNGNKKKPRNELNQYEFAEHTRFFKNMSPLLFTDSNFKNLLFKGLVDSKLLDNFFTFERSNAINFKQINSVVSTLTLNVFKVTISGRIINEQVFENTKKIFISGYIFSIEPSTFKDLKSLKNLYIAVYSLALFYNSGTKWMESLNSKVKVNYSKPWLINPNDQFVVTLSQSRSNLINQYSYDDEDFCLFNSIPFDNFVILEPKLRIISFENCTCTIQWLLQYQEFFNVSKILTCKLNSTRCDFKLMRKKCSAHSTDQVLVSANQSIVEVIYDISDEYWFYKKFDSIFSLFMFPIVCLLGILLN